MGKNSLLSTDLWKDYARDALERHLKWMQSPAYKRMVEESRARWKAKPWHERALIRTKTKVSQARIRLGEIIAGQRFDEE